MALLTRSEWDSFLHEHPEAHILQSSAWGALKSEFGWQVAWVRSSDSGAQILFRSLPGGLSIAYIPKGPVGSSWKTLWPEVDALCKTKNAIFLKVEPDAWEPLALEVDEQLPGFRAAEAVQPRRTIEVSLEGDEEIWLERMKQKTRYNIRLAERKGVIVRLSDDVDLFYSLMQETSLRDGFGIHSLRYYRRAYELFAPMGACALLLAEYEGLPLAGLMVFAWGRRAWYFYGASNERERQRMPTYLLQWEAMRWAAAKGCTTYDLWGIPDEEEATLEAEFTQRSDGLWGVYRFKRGFGGTIRRSVGAWDRVYKPFWYRLYQAWVYRRKGGMMG